MCALAGTSRSGRQTLEQRVARKVQADARAALTQRKQQVNIGVGGIDVGAKYEIYQLILDLANKGKTVIMVSSEMPELLGVCDRILVMSGGRLAGEVDAKTATQEDIMRLAAKYV